MTETPVLDNVLEQRLNDAVATAHYRLTLANQRSNAKLKLQKDLIFAINGGMFEVGQELIAFIGALVTTGQDDAIVLDINKNPIEITDLAAFQESLINHYFECMNDYLREFKAIKKSRTVKALIGE